MEVVQLLKAAFRLLLMVLRRGFECFLAEGLKKLLWVLVQQARVAKARRWRLMLGISELGLH